LENLQPLWAADNQKKGAKFPWLLDKKSHTHFCKWDLFF
jgi:hypothetical protein